MKSSRLWFLWEDREATNGFRTGVSLHGHTMHSRENLGFLQGFVAKVPLLSWEIRRLERDFHARTGKTIDYTRGYWSPPLPSREAHALERWHIEQRLGLGALVSLSDHNNIEAGCELRLLDETRDTPISIEWTVPVGTTYFHLGIHNLPSRNAHTTVADLARYGESPSARFRGELLASLSCHPDVLIVLNHPLWDQAGVGAANHHAMLQELLRTSGEHIHALELNGLRTRSENQAVADLARTLDYPLISGGDRHTCEPSSVVNLTRATGFSEFVSEVRGGMSEVAFLDHYRQPLKLRLLKAVCDIMRDYPELPGRVHWSDRVFCQAFSGATVPISTFWNGNTPRVVRYFERATRVVGNNGMLRAAHQMIEMSAADGVPGGGPRGR